MGNRGSRWKNYESNHSRLSEVVTMLTFQEELLKQQLNQLPGPSRVAFAASCAQRMTSACHSFAARICRPERAKLFDDALDYVWNCVLAPPERETTGRLLNDVMAIIPDEDAPGWSPVTPYGEDALSALAYSLSCLQSGDSQEAAWAAVCVYNATDYFVTSRDGISPSEPGAEARTLGDPAIQAELERQSRDVADLSAAGEFLSRELVENVRRRSVANQAVPIAG